MTEEQFEAIQSKLDTVIRLFAMNVGSDLSTKERAPLLQRAGLDRNDIAAVCDSSVEAISVRLAEAKRKKPGKKRK